MRYRNKYTGVVVAPSDALTAQSFARSGAWEELETDAQADMATGPGKNPGGKRPRRGKKGGGTDAAGD